MLFLFLRSQTHRNYRFASDILYSGQNRQKEMTYRHIKEADCYGVCQQVKAMIQKYFMYLCLFVFLSKKSAKIRMLKTDFINTLKITAIITKHG